MGRAVGEGDGSRFCDDEHAVSVVAVVVLMAVTVTVAAVPLVMLNLGEGVGAPAIAGLEISLEAGAAGWGTGDESVQVKHGSGELLKAEEVQVLLRGPAGDIVLQREELGLGAAVLFAAPGDPWRYTMDIPYGVDVHVEVVVERMFQEVLVDQEDLTAGSDTFGGLDADSVVVAYDEDEVGGGGAEGGEGEGGGDEGAEADEGDGGHDHDAGDDEEVEVEADEDGKVTICHYPPGGGTPKTLSVGAGAVQAHLDHGDKLGPCA